MQKSLTTRFGTDLSVEQWRDLPLTAVQAVRARIRWKTIRVMCPQCGRRLQVPVQAFTVRPDGTLESDRSLTCADDDVGAPFDGCGAVWPVSVRWAGLEA